MYAVDFEYDGRCLSEYGLIICYFDRSTGSETATAGSNITFNKISRFNGKKHSLISTEYSECISTIFDVCKNPDLHDANEMRITDNEFREIMRWLNRRTFLPLHFFDEGDPERERCYFDASFNIEKIFINDILIGLRLTVETNSPFGYGDLQKIVYELTSNNNSFSFKDSSDEIGMIFPVLDIVCNSSGNLEINNSKMSEIMRIANCSSGEHIVIDCENQTIATSNASHKIMDDFNWYFFRIVNDFNDNVNNIASSLPITLTIYYKPIIKSAM